MAVMKVCILKNGRVLPWTAKIEPKAERVTLWDTERRCAVDAGGIPVGTAEAAAGEPPVPPDLEVLPGPGAAAAAAAATPKAVTTAADIKGKQALREYAIATFGVELPARATEEHLRERIAALERAAVTQGMDTPAGTPGVPGPAGDAAPDATSAEPEDNP